MGKFIDITGQRFGMNVVLRRVPGMKNGSTLWMARCDCGKEKTYLRRDLVANKSCGCSRRVDLTGRRFGRLVAIRHVGYNRGKADSLKSKRVSGNSIWLFRCDCGVERDIVASSLTRGRKSTRSCGCLADEARKGNKYTQLPEGRSARNAVYSQYARAAKRRSLDWTLSNVDFDHLTSKKCHYCGCAPSNCTNKPTHNGDFIYNGIDRVADEVGYILGNCVPCCRTCNFMKNSMGQHLFLEQIERIFNHQIKNLVSAEVALEVTV